MTYKQLEVKTKRTSFSCGNREVHHNTELKLNRNMPKTELFFCCFFFLANKPLHKLYYSHRMKKEIRKQ